jgi:hypothetical protein
MLSSSEAAALGVFRSYMVGVGQMLCFDTPQMAKHRKALDAMVEKDYVRPERVAGAYSMTKAGMAALSASVTRA